MHGKRLRDRVRRLFIIEDERYVELDGRATRIAFYVGIVLALARFSNELWVNGIVRIDILSIGAALVITWTATMVYLGLTR